MLTRNKRIKGRCLFPNPNASVLSQYGSIFQFIPTHWTHDGSYLVKHRQAPKQETAQTIRQVQAATASLSFSI